MANLSDRWPILANWKFFFVLGLPIILLPLLILDDHTIVDGVEVPTTKYRAAYVILLMAIYWMVEAIPLAVTSFLPVVLFPLFGVMSTSEVSVNYMTETNMMFVGGLIIALAVEYSHLHKRIALRVMTIIGSSPTRIMLGIMLTTMFLSMWISNTATTAMMVPIVLAVLDELNKSAETQPKEKDESVAIDIRKHSSASNGKLHLANGGNQTEVQVNDNADEDSQTIALPEALSEKELEAHKTEQTKMYLFATAYSSNIGGTGVVTGTAPSLIGYQMIQKLNYSQNGKYLDLTFATWMAYNVPTMLLNVLVAWGYLIVLYFGVPDWLAFWRKNKSQVTKEETKKKEESVQKMLDREYAALGSMNFHETAVAMLFFLVVMLWLWRDPTFIPGWGNLLPSAEVGDSTAAMLVVFILFIIPKDPSFLFGKKTKQSGALLDWKYVQSNLPWGVVLLMGGGFAISDAATKSGLSDWIGEQLNGLGDLPNPAILLFVMIMTALATEVASNAACANVFLPILISLSKRLNLHPLYLTFPAAITCSFAFMLPVATPPNAIVFAAAGDRMKIIDMVKTGAFLNVSCVVVLFLMHISYGNLLFDFDNFEYAAESNFTTTVSSRFVH